MSAIRASIRLSAFFCRAPALQLLEKWGFATIRSQDAVLGGASMQHFRRLASDKMLLVGRDDPDRHGRVVSASQPLATLVPGGFETGSRPPGAGHDLTSCCSVVLADTAGEHQAVKAAQGGDVFYMHLADLRSYLEADERLCELYRAEDDWAKKSILNVAGSGKFSSDRAISEYAGQIWHAEPCPVR